MWKWSRFSCLGITFLSISVICLAIAAALPPFVNNKLIDGIKQQISLSPDAEKSNSQGWQTWVSNAGPDGVIPINKIWVWNTTNPEEVINGAKPILKQVGPYSYRSYNVKFNYTFETDRFNKQYLKYKPYEYYVYDAGLSGPGLDPDHDILTTPNTGYFGVWNAMKEEVPNYLYNLYKDRSEWQRFYWQHSPNALVFTTNFTDYVLDQKLRKKYPGLQPNDTSIEEADTFDFSSIYTGEKDSGLTRQFRTYEGMDSIMVPASKTDDTLIFPWGDEEANWIQGSDGGQSFPPLNYLEKGASVVIYSDRLCRAISLVNTGGATIEYEGIELLKFVLDKTTLLSISEHPDNAPYWTNLGGFWNLTTVQAVPIIISMPHFLNVPEQTASKVVGMQPDSVEHELFIAVEPNTGLTMHGKERFQINLYFDQPHVVMDDDDQPVVWFAKVQPQMAHPIIWSEFGGSIPPDKASTFKSSVYLAQGVITGSRYTGIILGLITGIAALVCFVFERRIVRTELGSDRKVQSSIDRQDNPSDPLLRR